VTNDRVPEPGPGGPRVRRVLETALYVDDLSGAVKFYEAVVGLRPISQGERLVAMDCGHGSVLLLFRRGMTTTGGSFPGGWIPPHDGHGPAHLAFAIDAGDLDGWRRHLAEHDVAIESEVAWDRGGTSLYFRDPDGHSVELATPGVWEVY
jgi:catechol 2,3-dioxygenase-like lactoylglutathione lyase family enzyme